MYKASIFGFHGQLYSFGFVRRVVSFSPCSRSRRPFIHPFSRIRHSVRHVFGASLRSHCSYWQPFSAVLDRLIRAWEVMNGTN